MARNRRGLMHLQYIIPISEARSNISKAGGLTITSITARSLQPLFPAPATGHFITLTFEKKKRVRRQQPTLVKKSIFFFF